MCARKWQGNLFCTIHWWETWGSSTKNSQLPAPTGTFWSFIRDIAELTGLDLDQLIAVDRMPIARTLGAAPVGSTWPELGVFGDLDLDFDLRSQGSPRQRRRKRAVGVFTATAAGACPTGSGAC